MHRLGHVFSNLHSLRYGGEIGGSLQTARAENSFTELHTGKNRC